MIKSRQQVLGQNFLHHQPTIAKIIQHVADQLKSSTQVCALVEVGPGKKALTNHLVKLAQSHPAKLFLIERDRNLEATLADSNQYSVHFMDAASEDFCNFLQSLVDQNLTPFYFVSNLPYSAAAPIIANLCQFSKHLAGATIMVQKEMADRMKAPAQTSERGSFSLLLESYFIVKKLFDVGPGAFSPPPKIMSTVLELTPNLNSPIHQLTSSEQQAFQTFCKKAFSQRRKMIRKLFAPHLHEAFSKLHISGTERCEDLSLETMIALYRLK